MKNELQKIAIRKGALYISIDQKNEGEKTPINEHTYTFLQFFKKAGFHFSPELLLVLNQLRVPQKMAIYSVFKEVYGLSLNWSPLIKKWDKPLSIIPFGDKVEVWINNLIGLKSGYRLPCNHYLPEDSFFIKNFNGCPICGTPFRLEKLVIEIENKSLKMLTLWTDEEAKKYLRGLLNSNVPLDATQQEELTVLLHLFEMPKDVEIGMKETVMYVVDAMVKNGKSKEATIYFQSPSDILRYLWFKHTGYVQLVKPKTIIHRGALNNRNLHQSLDKKEITKQRLTEKLKLKFSRTEAKIYAYWLNDLKMEVRKQCENMHPQRGIWVRVIRALRLAEYSKRKGFEHLAKLLDVFYNKDYEVWQGKVQESKLKVDAEQTFELLKQRPSLFARSLFSSMLWFGPEVTIDHFKKVMHQLPTRLVFTLNMYADTYFDNSVNRVVRPLGGMSKRIPKNPLIEAYTEEDIQNMIKQINQLTYEVIRTKLMEQKSEHYTMFIDSHLFDIPFSIGDRSNHIQDVDHVPAGARYKLKGDKVRLFIQWGEGLKAQHLDMDLSCLVIYPEKKEYCSYSNLQVPGCKHSGDIQYIPDNVGTAEYIDIDIPYLEK